MEELLADIRILLVIGCANSDAIVTHAAGGRHSHRWQGHKIRRNQAKKVALVERITTKQPPVVQLVEAKEKEVKTASVMLRVLVGRRSWAGQPWPKTSLPRLYCGQTRATVVFQFRQAQGDRLDWKPAKLSDRHDGAESLGKSYSDGEFFAVSVRQE